jgi:ribosomal protein L11 methylase PrmA
MKMISSVKDLKFEKRDRVLETKSAVRTGLDKFLIGYHPTPLETVQTIVEVADLSQDDLLCDLGSGDGRIPIAAAAIKGIRSFGFELNPYLVELSRRNIAKNGVQDLAGIIEGDFLDYDHESNQNGIFRLRGATVVTMYMCHDVMDRIQKTLVPKFNEDAVVISVNYPFDFVQPKRHIGPSYDAGDLNLFLYAARDLQKKS